MKRTVFILSLLLVLCNAAAQSRKVSGRVVDPDGQPVIAAGAVCPEKPTAGTVTDIDGRFSLNVPTGATRILFSALGMQEAEYPCSVRCPILTIHRKEQEIQK